MHLRLLILKLLKEGEKTGYDLIKTIERESGWKPSPGSIYPHLSDLKKKSFIKVKEEGRRKIYFITNKGMNELNNMKSEMINIVNTVSKRIKVVDNLFGHNSRLSEMLGFISEQLRRGRLPFGKISKDVIGFRDLLFMKLRDERNHEEIKKIINEAFRKLEKI